MADSTSDSHTAFEKCLAFMRKIFPADPEHAGSFSSERRSEYFSPRIEGMMQSRSQFASDIGHEIEHSKVHWSEVTGSTATLSEEDEEEENRENRKIFLELLNDPQWKIPDGRDPEGFSFFIDRHPYVLGQKIAEGGQAEIFEILLSDGSVASNALMKVFKRRSLSQLRQQWPDAVLRRDVWPMRILWIDVGTWEVCIYFDEILG